MLSLFHCFHWFIITHYIFSYLRSPPLRRRVLGLFYFSLHNLNFLIATSVLGRLYAGDFQTYFHWTKRWTHWRPECRRTVYGATRTKPQFIWLGTRQQLASIDLHVATCTFAANFPQYILYPSEEDLGVTLTQAFTFANHSWARALQRIRLERALYKSS